MPDLIRHPVLFWIPAFVPFRVFAGMTTLTYIVARVIILRYRAVIRSDPSRRMHSPFSMGFSMM